jgi:hypothetical protein
MEKLAAAAVVADKELESARVDMELELVLGQQERRMDGLEAEQGWQVG